MCHRPSVTVRLLTSRWRLSGDDQRLTPPPPHHLARPAGGTPRAPQKQSAAPPALSEECSHPAGRGTTSTGVQQRKWIASLCMLPVVLSAPVPAARGRGASEDGHWVQSIGVGYVSWLPSHLRWHVEESARCRCCAAGPVSV